MTASAGPALRRFHREYGDRIAFVTLYVREAHPGERYPQPTTMDEKIRHARDYAARDGIPWPIVVDDLEGGFHRALDDKPNAAYLVDARGVVAFRTLWSNDVGRVEEALRAAARGEPLPERHRESQRKAAPMMRGLGCMRETFRVAGGEAARDVAREVPPMYGLAWLASLFRPLPPP